MSSAALLTMEPKMASTDRDKKEYREVRNPKFSSESWEGGKLAAKYSKEQVA